MLHRFRIAAGIALIAASPVAGWAQTSTCEGNDYDYRDWPPTRGQVREEERAAGVRQTLAERNSQDQELHGLYKDLLRQEQPSSLVQPGNSR
jgi:hypothetical protein